VVDACSTTITSQGQGGTPSISRNSLQQLSDDVTTAVIMEELFFKQQVEKGLQDVAEGRVLTQQEMKEGIARWRKSAGR
jgi:predicted transcriptional regulator